MRLPDGVGLELLKGVGRDNGPSAVWSSLRTARLRTVEALKPGAFDYPDQTSRPQTVPDNGGLSHSGQQADPDGHSARQRQRPPTAPTFARQGPSDLRGRTTSTATLKAWPKLCWTNWSATPLPCAA
jgi:hypothetical protein